MSEMIEKVAKAIYAGMTIEARGNLPDDWDKIGPDHEKARQGWRKVARAALIAMREPTPEMLDAAAEVDGLAILPEWQSAIDAALGEAT